MDERLLFYIKVIMKNDKQLSERYMNSVIKTSPVYHI